MIAIPAGTMDRFGLAPPKFKPGFFVDHRKGEVGELRLLLRKMATDYKSSSSLNEYANSDNNAKCREILKRLIRCMTLGMDVSRLYTDVVMISHTTDPVQKKMIYMFLSTYSKDNPDLTVLTINTLLKDVENVDPVIRCLAIRNISAFDTKLSNDYAKNVVLKKLHDPSDAVKRSAIIGSLRIYKSQCAIAKKERLEDVTCEEYRSDILQHLQSSVKSLNLDVMFDSLCIYSEMIEPEDDLRLTKPSVVYLINRIKKMNEWQQCLTLKLLQTYIPVGDELFDLLNLLDDLLNCTSTAVFLATAKCFLTWTAHDDMLQLEVIRRLQIPMIALLSQSCNEIAYNILLNTLLIVVNAPQLEDVGTDSNGAEATHKLPFADHYEVFFFRYDDPSYIKHVKLNLLVAIACEENSLEILNDLNEYVSDTNHDIAAKSVKAMGIIALKAPGHLETIISQISVVFSLRIPYIISAALYVVKALLRVYPAASNKLLQIVEDHRGYIKEPQALSYYIWILGEYGGVVEHAPYTLEDIIEMPESLEITKELLCASVKLFFTRPPEMYNAIRRLFCKIINESQDPDLIGMASFYYAMLSTDIEMAQKIVMAESQQDFTSMLENSMVDLGISLPSANWRETFNSFDLFEDVRPQGKPPLRFFPYSYGDVDTDIFTSSATSDVHTTDRDDCAESVHSYAEDTTLEVNSTNGSSFDMTLDDCLGPLKLVVPSTLLSEEYQKNWFECDLICQSTDEVVSDIKDLNIEPLEDMLFDVHIATLASGRNHGATKMYQYAQNSDG
ncbi:Beta-adaptin-like protein A [Babesia sp. Xinjiang]|uniref:Beta-adaptin-like protein A n=1 Tax=Babesia sp. Xinjiang TaxID=462227 RepID=UPI000A25CDA5|nr:Beta-adaptin-like protein A [Babesia sp. Xinjiang]ORM39573.1 Beta-adaptin-like protein A [Babesia sp. Xinjiang]